jgi:hypothetical protein
MALAPLFFTSTYLKKVFCPNIFVDAKFKSSEYLSMPAVQILHLP